MNQIIKKLTKGLEENPEARLIRQTVFVEEQGFQQEFDEIDPIAWHLVLWIDGAPAATGRTFLGQGKDGAWTIGRVAVVKSHRGQGLGASVVRELERAAKAQGARSFVLSAQVRAKGFYEAIGYRAHGEPYLDEYCPHVTMTKPAGKDNEEEQS